MRSASHPLRAPVGGRLCSERLGLGGGRFYGMGYYGGGGLGLVLVIVLILVLMGRL